MKLKTWMFLKSNSLKDYYNKISSSKILIFIISLIVLDAILTFQRFRNEINPVVISLIATNGLVMAMIMKTTVMTTCTIGAYYCTRKDITNLAKKCFTVFAFLLLALTFSNLVNATIYNEDFTSYQFLPSSIGRTHQFNSHISSTGIAATYSANAGMSYQPLTMSIGTNTYIISYSGNYLQVRNQFTSLSNEYNVGGAIFCQPSLTDDWNGDGLPEIHIASNGNITIFEYNGTNFKKNYTFAIHAGFASVCNGIRCFKHTVEGDRCYLASAKKLWSYNMTGYSNISITTMNAVAGVPSAEDMDASSGSKVWLAIKTDDNSNANLGFDLINPKTSTRVCSADDINAIVSNPIIYNLDGAGSAETIIQRPGIIRAYKTDCSQLWTTTYDTLGGALSVSQMVIRNSATGTVFVCGYETSSLVSGISVGCTLFDGTLWNTAVGSGRISTIYNSGCGTTACLSMSLFAGDTDGDGGDELIMPGAILEVTSTDYTVSTNLSQSFKGKIAFADLSDDTEGEIIYGNSTITKTMYSGYTNAPPTLNTRSFGQNYCGYICTGTTVTFYAKECNQTNCHYNEDNPFDTERLISNCNINSTYNNGTFSLTNPTLSCYYPSPGNYIFNVYLQDQSNKNEFTQYHSITLSVINGTPGTDCNFAPTSECVAGAVSTTGTGTSATGGGTLTSSDLAIITDTLTGGGSTLVKSILVLIFCIMTIFALAKMGIHNPGIYGMSLVVVLFICALIGLMSMGFIVVIGFLILLIAAVTWVKGGSSN